MRNIRYLASYTGPSYGSMDQYSMDGFLSLNDAMKSMWFRQRDGSDHVREYQLNDQSDVYQLKSFRHVSFPATTPEDVMDVHYAKWDEEEEGWVLGDWMYRVFVGPRGGIRSEKA